MAVSSNPNLLNIQGLFIDDTDSHARPGSHVRVSHHPLLELPVAPFVLERADVDVQLLTRLKLRKDAVYIDQTGRQRVPPFSIGPGDTITIRLPTDPGSLALWAEILMDPGGGQPPRADAYLRATGQQDGHLGTRVGMPLAFSGTGILRMVLRGRGTVVGVRWLDAAQEQKGLDFRLVDLLNLPHRGGPRYAQLAQWKDLCDRRRDEQAPTRRPLQDTDGAPARFTAPPHNAASEAQRIDAFFAGLEGPLGDLIEDFVPQLDQVDDRPMTDATGNNISADGSAELRIRTLGLFLQGQADPGMASYCGYKTRDTGTLKLDNHVFSIYRLTAFFRNPSELTLRNADAAGELFRDHVEAARQNGGILSTDDIEQAWRARADPFLTSRGITATFDLAANPGLGMTALGVVDTRAPLQPPARPRLDEPAHINWLPTGDIDRPERVTETYVRDLLAGAAMSATRRQPINPASWMALNSALDPSGWRALILPNIPNSGPFARPYGNDLPDAFLSDSATGPGAFRVLVAQSDRFGRYSEWAAAQGEPGPRPKPPRPVVQGSYRQPDTETGGHRGTVTLTIPLPEDDALAPGAFPLENLSLQATHAGAPFTLPAGLNPIPVSDAVSIHPDAPVSAAEDRRGLRVTFNGPTLAPTSSSTMVFTAQWRDSDGQLSALSEPLTLTLTDPYPPTQMPIADTLLYSARPDATGKAWVERRWTHAGESVAYAVYYADENRLRAYLREPDARAGEAATLLATLQATADPAARAGQLRAAQDLFPGYLFERLKDVILPVDGAGNTGFRHALSGGLRVLSAYKIAAEAAKTAARPDLATLDTVFYGVPNSDPPARPVITARSVTPEPGEPDLVVELTVKLRPGATLGETVRLRRTRSGEVDALRNPVIGTTLLGPPDPVTGLQTATFRDTGAAQIAPSALLAPFIGYAWIAEAQGAAEPGSAGTSDGAIAGLWSQASLPATLDVIPQADPVAPSLLGMDGARTAQGVRGLTLDFSYPLNLVPTSLGPWTVIVDRRLPGQSATRLQEGPAPAGTRITVPGDPDDPAFEVPTGTLYRLRLRDPIGRQSASVDLTV